MKNRSKQQGMAMLTALMVVALASSLAVSLWYGTASDLARLNHVQHNYQSKHLTQGLLLWASDVLRQDYEQSDTQSDGNQDGWLQGIQNMPVESAVLSGQLKGMNHCFNVNNLWQDNQVSEVHRQYLLRLLRLLQLDEAIVDQMIDWQDSDQLPRPQGAEDAAYQGHSPSHKSGQGPFMHINELVLLPAVTTDVFNALKRYVCVLPASGLASKMNINTLPPVMIRALTPAITEPLANTLFQEGRAHHETLQSFFQKSQMQIISQDEEVKNEMMELLDVRTLWIEAQATVTLGEGVYVSYALMQRSSTGAATAVQRSQSPFHLTDEVK